MTIQGRVTSLLIVCLVMGTPFVEAVQEGRVLSIRELIDVKEKWPLFAENKIGFTIRGRVGSRTNDEIHMRNCKLRFLQKSSKTFPKLKPGSFMVKITGNFDRMGNTPVFRVSRVTSEFSQEQLHRQKSVDMKTTDPNAWRKLAAYTAAEARFYKDDKLFQVAASAFEHAYRVERAAINNETPQMIRAWIQEMKEFGVSSDDVELWEHDLYQIRWRSFKDKPENHREEILQLAGLYLKI